MSEQIKTMAKASRATRVVVLLLFAALVGRISVQADVRTTDQANMPYHHVHHSLTELDQTASAHQAAIDPTSVPHHHSDDLDDEQHQHCHTHGMAHVANDLLYFSAIEFNVPLAIARHEQQYIKFEKRIFSTYSAHHFRPPILS